MKLAGKGVSDGIAIGHIVIYKKDKCVINKSKAEDTSAEVMRFNVARDEAKKQLDGLYEKALQETGAGGAAIFEAHRMILDDPAYVDLIIDKITTGKINAEFAVAEASDILAEKFDAIDDELLKARAADVKDISSRVLSILQGREECGREEGKPEKGNREKGELKEDYTDSDEQVIIFADDLAPSETLQLDKSKVMAFVTRRGSTNSHTAILARTMNIPALVSIDYPEDCEGKMAVVDGRDGVVYIDPDEKTVAYYRENTTLDYTDNIISDCTENMKINVFANIGGIDDVELVLQNDAEGIGLFRSEFLYLKSNDYPSEEAQFNVYRQVAEKMEGRKVIIRTMDIGADKQADYFGLDKEDNPAMGYRGIRICLDRTGIFKTQLRAILRAGYYGNIAVMYPMIISLEEVKRIKEIFDEVRKELDREGKHYGQVEQGIMIETPAAVLMSEELAQEVDFLSIGTNDLTQFMLACDRQNSKLDKICDPHHPAVLRAIKMTIENGHKAGARVGICGEIAGDTTLTEIFIRMGIDELSVNPGRVTAVRDAVRKATAGK